MRTRVEMGPKIPKNKKASKDVMVRVLTENGYDAVSESGVVVVRFTDISKADKLERSVLKLFKEEGYDASYGFHYIRGG